ncbi:GNAT family N-acetyltransferase [Galbitalea sp. SE-J8]|uniref:GNAT family N-acetyltransferase n=1 Tax=Galbitalea sp. SE-J8 TaxID=3054952 RepID=UPI00259CA002|nr:GNAT family N-acetyltransferase [Galbitalea sp. SE-J8]MDM4762509.1 GNAT family N-acetyltransferase [Galbitalea sp. SE-J8]
MIDARREADAAAHAAGVGVRPGVIDARREADAAAHAAGVGVRPVDGVVLVPFLESIWGAGRAGDPALLRVIAHAGNSVLAAYRDERIVGAALGVLGWTDGLHLHSHMVAVDPGLRAGGVGFAIKLAQRAECLDHGVAEMRWTFDPLIRRNAHLNLVKLGARVLAYRPHFYGELADAINGDDATDRFEVGWRLDAPLGAAPAGGPAEVVLPPDYEALRREDAAAARVLRATSGAAFASAAAAGRGIRFTGDGYRFG